MSTTKKVLFIAVLITIVSILIYLLLFSKTDLNINNRNVDNNPARKVMLDEGTYNVDSDLKPGYYDITGISGEVAFRTLMIKPGDKLLNYPIQDSTSQTIEGNGRLQFTPSSFQPLKKDSNNDYKVEYGGYYLIGEELPADNYEITSLSGSVHVFIYKSNENSKTKDSFELNPSLKSKKINLVVGNSLLIVPISDKENTNLQIVLSPEKN